MTLEEFKQKLVKRVERLEISAEDAFEEYDEAMARSLDGVTVYENKTAR